MPDELLDLIEAADRVDQSHKPETIERALKVHAMLAAGGTLTQAAKAVGRAYSTTKWLATIDLIDLDPSPRRAIIATLGLASPRAPECCALDLRDADLGNRRLAIRGTKTEAADRKVWIVDFLHEELLRYKHEMGLSDPYAPLYPTATGRQRTKDNLRQRVLPAVVREANRVRRKRGAPPISEEITPHTLRRTFISLQLAYGRDVSFVQRQVNAASAASRFLERTAVRRPPTRSLRREIGATDGRLRSDLQSPKGQMRDGPPLLGSVASQRLRPEREQDAKWAGPLAAER
jgi:integrase